MKASRKKPKRSQSLTDLRREAEVAGDHLIDLLNRTDPFFDEREHAVDEDPCDDLEEEPLLGSSNDYHGMVPAIRTTTASSTARARTIISSPTSAAATAVILK